MTAAAAPGDPASAGAALGASATRAVRRRLLPFLFLLYDVAYLDRVNVGFAALHMNRDLGLTPAAFGFGAGVFFVGYALFEVPSNLLLVRMGARRWIARILLTWGLVSVAMLFARGPVSFAALRFCLGAAEAGFFPGVIYYLGDWFPAEERARAIGWFSSAIPLSSVLGGPLAGALLALDGRLGLAGWQWLFLLEGLPAVLLAPVVLARLPDRPAEARWLTADQRAWLGARIAREQAACAARHGVGLREAFAHPVVWRLGAFYCLASAGAYGLALWVPQMVRGLSGLGDFLVGVVSAVPYVVAAVAMVVVSARSDQTGERVKYLTTPGFVAALGLMVSALAARSPALALAALTVGAAANLSRNGPFWALPGAFLTGSAAAGGIALINTMGALGGFAGPWAVGVVRGATGGFAGGLAVLALLVFGSAVLALPLRGARALAPAGPAPAAPGRGAGQWSPTRPLTEPKSRAES